MGQDNDIVRTFDYKWYSISNNHEIRSLNIGLDKVIENKKYMQHIKEHGIN